MIITHHRGLESAALPVRGGTVVERTTRYVLLLHLPGGRDAHLVEQAITGLSAELARTIT
jgi:hypothetical protein